MLVLIIGGSGSGKSAYAEDYISKISEGRKKYYLATMQVFDQETMAKVKKHQEARSGKGFITIEQPVSIGGVSEKIKGNAALLECMSNLTANEMFSAKTPMPWEAAVKKIVREIDALNRQLKVLVIVTNNVFEDGIAYDGATEAYKRALGKINEQLADMADQVIEIVLGIPVILKEKK